MPVSRIPLLTLLLAANALMGQSPLTRQHLETQARAAERYLLEARRDLGLGSRDGFRARDSFECALGQIHTRLDQTFDGIKVYGGEIILHGDAQGFFRDRTAVCNSNIDVNTRPSFGEREAIALAMASMGLRAKPLFEPISELVIYPLREERVREDRRHLPLYPTLDGLNAEDMETRIRGYRLAYRVKLTAASDISGMQERMFVIDAHTGQLIEQWDNLRSDGAKGTGKSHYSGTVSLDVKATRSGFELRDTTRGIAEGSSGNVTLNCQNLDMTDTQIPEGDVYQDPDNTWGDGANYAGNGTTSDNGQTGAVDAHYGMQVAWDYYKRVHGRDGIDGKGTATSARVHVGKWLRNAFWADECFCMVFGDGSAPSSRASATEGGTACSQGSRYPPFDPHAVSGAGPDTASFPMASGYKMFAGLDVVAHEFSHGVCANSAAIEYKGESAALNESNSDINAAMVDFYAGGGGYASQSSTVPETGGNWTMGETVKFPKPMRILYKPSLDGSSLDEWKTNAAYLPAHYVAGVGNRAFYFMSQGATSSGDTSSSYLPNGMRGVGNDKAARIWYRALTTYMTSTSKFLQARQACIRAAQDLFGAGSAEEAAVHNAFGAVNVGKVWDGATEPQPDPEPPTPALKVTVSPASATVEAGKTFQFSASVTGSTNTTVTWSATGGSISSTGLFTAPQQAGTFKVRATAKADGAKFAEGTVTVKAGATPQPPGPTVGNLIQNGGFESGRSPWAGTASFIGAFAEQKPFAGKACTWMGGNGSEATETLYQDVVIPKEAGDATLTFQLHIDTAEQGSSIYDVLAIELLKPGGELLKKLATYSNADAISGYLKRSFNLSEYAGQSLRVQFKSTEDVSIQTSFVLDDVSLTVKGGGASQSDTQAPTVSGSVSGTKGTITLNAKASDNVGVSSVEFYVDGALQGTDKTAPYSWNLDSATFSKGSHKLDLKAFDAAGNVGSSKTVLFNVDNSTPNPEPPQPEGDFPNPDAERIKADVAYLCNDECEGRKTGTPGAALAANYIVQQFSNAGLQPLNAAGFGGPTTYHVPFNTNEVATVLPEGAQIRAEWWVRSFADGVPCHNLAAVLPGSDPNLKNEYIVLSAHYDHVGRKHPVFGGQIYRGADDNASGTSALVEIARCLQAFKPTRSILFLAFSGEEMGLKGSEAFLKQERIPLDKIKACINMDMLGRNAADEVHLAPAKIENLVTSLARDARAAAEKHGVLFSADLDSHFKNSDQYSFSKRGIPSLFINTGLHPDLHQVTDTPDKLDYDKIARMARVLRDLTVKVSKDSAAPLEVPKSEWSTWKWGNHTAGSNIGTPFGPADE